MLQQCLTCVHKNENILGVLDTQNHRKRCWKLCEMSSKTRTNLLCTGGVFRLYSCSLRQYHCNCRYLQWIVLDRIFFLKVTWLHILLSVMTTCDYSFWYSFSPRNNSTSCGFSFSFFFSLHWLDTHIMWTRVKIKSCSWVLEIDYQFYTNLIQTPESFSLTHGSQQDPDVTHSACWKCCLVDLWRRQPVNDGIFLPHSCRCR